MQHFIILVICVVGLSAKPMTICSDPCANQQTGFFEGFWKGQNPYLYGQYGTSKTMNLMNPGYQFPIEQMQQTQFGTPYIGMPMPQFVRSSASNFPQPAQTLGQPTQSMFMSQPGQSTFMGQPSQGMVMGQPGQEMIMGQPGQGMSLGQPGQNTVFGQPGQSTVFGQPGQSTVFGQPGQSTVFGQPGESTVFGQPGQSTVFGQPGQSSVFGQPGQNFMMGPGMTYGQTPQFGNSVPIMTEMSGHSMNIQGQPYPVMKSQSLRTTDPNSAQQKPMAV